MDSLSLHIATSLYREFGIVVVISIVIQIILDHIINGVDKYFHFQDNNAESLIRLLSLSVYILNKTGSAENKVKSL